MKTLASAADAWLCAFNVSNECDYGNRKCFRISLQGRYSNFSMTTSFAVLKRTLVTGDGVKHELEELLSKSWYSCREYVFTVWIFQSYPLK